MTKTELETLRHLIVAWDEGEQGAGAALHDLMEELNWPWEWKRLKDEHLRLFLPGFDQKYILCIAAIFDEGIIVWDTWTVGIKKVKYLKSNRLSNTVTEAKAAVEAFFKQHWKSC